MTGVPGLAVKGGVVEVTNAHAAARISLQGAHVLTYGRTGRPPLLWLSKRAVFAPGKAVRGGVPVCWPWFGPHPTDAAQPAHGFARTAVWSLEDARLEDGAHKLLFRLPSEAGAAVGWRAAVDLCLEVGVGPVLALALTATNNGTAPVTLGGALHSYIAVGDVTRIRITGLEKRPFIDQLNPAARPVQEGPVVFTAETDRVYDDPGPRCVIEDPVLNRRVTVEKAGSRSTVVWNPWPEKARRMADLGEDQHRDFVCVETANALSDVVTVPAGGVHRLSAVLKESSVGDL